MPSKAGTSTTGPSRPTSSTAGPSRPSPSSPGPSRPSPSTPGRSVATQVAGEDSTQSPGPACDTPTTSRPRATGISRRRNTCDNHISRAAQTPRSWWPPPTPRTPRTPRTGTPRRRRRTPVRPPPECKITFSVRGRRRVLSALHQPDVLDAIAELLQNVAENPEDLDDLGRFIDQLTSKYNYYKDTSRDDRRTIAYRNSVRLDQTRDAALRLVNQAGIPVEDNSQQDDEEPHQDNEDVVSEREALPEADTRDQLDRNVIVVSQQSQTEAPDAAEERDDTELDQDNEDVIVVSDTESLPAAEAPAEVEARDDEAVPMDVEHHQVEEHNQQAEGDGNDFGSLLARLANAWKNDRTYMLEMIQELRENVAQLQRTATSSPWQSVFSQ